MAAAQSGAVRIGETLSFDRAWAAQARVVHGWFGNPFTYPASLSVRAAQRRVTRRLRSACRRTASSRDPLQPYGRVDVGNTDAAGTTTGCSGTAGTRRRETARSTFRWAASPATLRIPLDHAAPLRVQVRLHAFAYPGAPPQTLTISPRTARPAHAPRCPSRRTGKRSSARWTGRRGAPASTTLRTPVRLCAAARSTSARAATRARWPPRSTGFASQSAAHREAARCN